MSEKAAKTTRVQLEMPERSMARLMALKERTEAASYAEVMRNALRLYEDMIAKTDENLRVFLRDSEGKETEYRIF